MPVGSWLSRLILVCVAFCGGWIGLSSVVLARRADAGSWAGSSPVADLLLLVVGWSLIAAGLRLSGRRIYRPTGVLLTCSGFAWFVMDWNNQFTTSGVMFSAGIVLGTVCPVLVGHAVLRSQGRSLTTVGRLGCGVGYLSTVALAGVLPALTFDPAGQGCAACAENVLVLKSAPAVALSVGSWAVIAGLLWSALLLIAICEELLAETQVRRRLDGPMLLPAIGYLGAVGAGYLIEVGASFQPINQTTRFLWELQGILLVLTAFGTGWPAIRRNLLRARVARLAVDAAGTRPVGGLSSILSRTLRDPSLRLLYPLADGSVVDAGGRATAAGQRQGVTPVVRSGATVALLVHRPGRLADPELAAEITSAARLVLDNERLQAQTRAQLADLQASRARIVRAGDAERRRLERDLHDGAQQLLVALSLALALAVLRAGDPATGRRLDTARVAVVEALVQLRDLAGGIYPRELADSGLAAAIRTLAEGSAVPLAVLSVPTGRFPHSVESAAYQLVSRLTRSGAGATVSVTAATGILLVAVTVDEVPPNLLALEDRVGALGGELTVHRTESGAVIRAVLPCER